MIYVPIESVWNATATTAGLSAWAQSVRVESDWQVGGSIVYTCYDEAGDIVEWEGKKMIWSGIIETLDKPHIFTCVYPDSINGIEREIYTLESIEENTTRVMLEQTCTTSEIADKYKSGTEEMLQMMKSFLETNI